MCFSATDKTPTPSWVKRSTKQLDMSLSNHLSFAKAGWGEKPLRWGCSMWILLNIIWQWLHSSPLHRGGWMAQCWRVKVTVVTFTKALQVILREREREREQAICEWLACELGDLSQQPCISQTTTTSKPLTQTTMTQTSSENYQCIPMCILQDKLHTFQLNINDTSPYSLCAGLADVQAKSGTSHLPCSLIIYAIMF